MSVESAVDVGAAAPANEGAIAASVTTEVNGAQPSNDQPKSGDPWSEGSDLHSDLLKTYFKNNPDRDVTGKFAAKDKAPVATETAQPEISADQPDAAKTEQVTTAEPSKPAIDPPLSWSAEMKAKWAALPPELQTYVTQRDKESHTAYTQAGEKLKTLTEQIKSHEPLDQLITAHKDNFARRGVTAAQAFAVLLEAQRQLDSNPVSGLVQIGRTYGIDLQPALQGLPAQLTQQQPQQQVQEHPLFVQMKQQLEGKLDSLEKRLNEREIAEAQAIDQDIRDNIETFKAEKDKSGNLRRPYFDEVKPMMATLLKEGHATDLDAAYDTAVRATPSVFERIQADQRKTEEAKQKAEAEAKAKEARKANSVNVRGAPGTGTSPRTMDDTLHEVAAKHWPGYRRSAS
jgi:hypothetical protein